MEDKRLDVFIAPDGTILGAVLSRRRALRAMGLAGIAVGAAGLLAACGGAASSTATSSSVSSAATSSSAAATSSSAASSASSSTSSSVAASSTATSSSATSSAVASVAANLGAGQFNAGWPYQVPPTGHWNVFVTNAIDVGIYDDLINTPFAKYYWSSGKWLMIGGTDFKLEPPNKFSVTLRDGMKWDDGSPVTSKDVLTTFSVGRLMSFAVWQYLDKVTASGNTITFHMAKPASVVQRYVLEQRIYADSTFGQYAQKADALFSAGKKISDPEVKALLTEFQKFRPPELRANGPFMYDKNSITEAQLTLVRNPHGYQGKVGFAKIVTYNGETPTITPLVLAKQIDYGTYGFPPATVKAFEAEGIRILTPPSHSGAALYINYAKLKGLSNEQVRQALAYLIDRASNATFALGQSAVPQKYMAGLDDHLVEQWVEASDLSKLNQYPLNPGKAESMLQAAGWKKGSDGIWVDHTGAKWDYDLLVPSDYADWSGCAQNLAEQLTKFGLKTVVRGVEHTQAYQAVQKGNFNLAIQGWGAGSPYPQFAYQADILAYIPPQDPLGPGTSFNLVQDTKVAGKVNFQTLVTQSGEGLDVAQQKKAVTTMALAFNEVLPIIPIWEKLGNNPVIPGLRVQGWPPDSDPIYQNDYYADSFVIMMMYTGVLQPVVK